MDGQPLHDFNCACVISFLLVGQHALCLRHQAVQLYLSSLPSLCYHCHPIHVLTVATITSLRLTHVQVVVMCNGYRGHLLVGLQRVICMCSDCKKLPEAEREFSCTQYEQHCGAGAAKKWKASLRIEPGSVPEVPEGQPTLGVFSRPALSMLLISSQAGSACSEYVA